jgi:glucose-1-phosphate thymidylyltransferase
MKLIIPMAGMGKRMRPHTLSVPKPLIHIAGKPIVQRLVEEICSVSSEKIDEIAFVIGDFGKAVEEKLIGIAEEAGAKAHIFYQKEALGTAHAIFCAEKLLKGKTIVAFADTLFKAKIKLQEDQDSVIWVKEVENPEAFGVVKTTQENKITAFIEKPQTPVSNLAIIGIYYFKEAEKLAEEIAFLLENKILKNGEYQLTDALQNMMQQGIPFYANNISEWLDCGNKDATVYTNQRVLCYLKEEELLSKTMENHNSIIIPPCFIGENAKIKNSIIGPYVSVGKNSCIINSVIENSIIQEDSRITDANLKNSMIGNAVEYKGRKNDVSIGDYTSFK